MLAVMSGQGGIAVLVSGVQILLAVLSAVHPPPSGGASKTGDIDTGRQSTIAGVGLWALGSIGAFGCLLAHRYLILHPDYHLVLSPLKARGNQEEGDEIVTRTRSDGVTRRVFMKNIELEMAVAWVFVVCLVRHLA